jgi:hypothetical protein
MNKSPYQLKKPPRVSSIHSTYSPHTTAPLEALDPVIDSFRDIFQIQELISLLCLNHEAEKRACHGFYPKEEIHTKIWVHNIKGR